MPSSPFAVLDRFDPEDYVLTIRRAESRHDDLELHAEFSILATRETKKWSIQCCDVLDQSLKVGCDETDLRLVEDHQLLWPHNTPSTSLYFHGQWSDPETVIGALYVKHDELTDGWFDFNHWFNPTVKPTSLIAGGVGLLAEGPEPVIQGYEQVMQRFGFVTSTLSSQPMHWDAIKRSFEESGPAIALVGGESWVVARSIQVSAI